MPDNNDNTETVNVKNLVTDVLGQSLQSLAQPASQITLDDVTFHDFAKYEWLIEPSALREIEPVDLSDEGNAYLDRLETEGVQPEILEFLADLLLRVESTVTKACKDASPQSTRNKSVHLSLTASGSAGHRVRLIKSLYKDHESLIYDLAVLDREIPHLMNALYILVKQSARIVIENLNSVRVVVYAATRPSGIFDWPSFVSLVSNNKLLQSSVELVEQLAAHKIEIFPTNSTNIGVALIYRQRWKILGLQPGEIVRTIPLGPGQSERVVTKITRRRKRTTNMEQTSETETSTESTDTTKDSNEIVNEATKKRDWSLEASASFGFAGFGGSAKATTSGSSSKSNKQTTSSLSETMKKTASKIRRETKVTVSTESETGMETETTSEVKNTNDEAPLTLQYHMLQHQYEVYSYLYAVKSVLFVAEEVPQPYEIDETWVRRHDWIIADALLDESYRPILNELLQDIEVPQQPFGADDVYSVMINKAINKFASFNASTGGGTGGLSVPDIYAKPLEMYDQMRAADVARRREDEVRKRRRQRLFHHIVDNILHYCRAIWEREDSEARLLRYRKEGRLVPTTWKGPILESGAFDASQFEPESDYVNVDEAVADVTPLGITGNYIVFELKDVDRREIAFDGTSPGGDILMDVREVLDLVRARYTNETGTGLKDPAFDEFLEEAQGIVDADPAILETIDDATVMEFLSFMPHLVSEVLDEQGSVKRTPAPAERVVYKISALEWATYLFTKNGTRRFLVDSNNLYVSLLLGSGVALEPFKRLHRFIDVLSADEERRSHELKNLRRDHFKDKKGEFDPDIEKVVIVEGGTKASDVAGGSTGGGSN